MSSKEPAISVRGLGKRYTIAQQGIPPSTLAEAFAHRLRKPFAKPSTADFWAIKDVSFDIYAGDVVGIIGRNGAGKSTLLKLLSRITEPTTGQIDVWGRVGSLLEVGTGFHPELTGRENIFLNGTILGMTRAEIQRQFDAIVEFAEVATFLDTPVKRYSSGMYVRLAFAIAAHLNPEILIVDEVLAVGDTIFQKKCLGKMQDIAHEGGRTVLFVSHNMAAVRSLCTRGIVMRRGGIALDGDVESAISLYIQEGDATQSQIHWTAEEGSRPELRFLQACILNPNEAIPVALDCRNPFTLVLDFELWEPLTNLRPGFFLQNNEGVMICESNDPEWSGKERKPGHYQVRWTFPAYTINAGRYNVSFYADLPNDRVVIRTGYDLSFSVEDTEGWGLMAQTFPGVLRPQLRWEERRGNNGV